MKKIVPILFAVLCLSFIPVASADENIWDLAKSDQYGKKAGGMFGRGLLNFGTSFVDVIVHTVEGTQKGTPFIGTLTGLGSGIGCTALRAASGALDLVTFWVPGFNGIPVSRSYSNCLEESAAQPAAAPAAAPTPQPAAPATPAPEYAQKSNPMDYVKK